MVVMTISVIAIDLTTLKNDSYVTHLDSYLFDSIPDVTNANE